MFIKRKRRLSSSAEWLLAAVIVALAACVINCALGYFATWKWERYAAEIRGSGMPLTWEEVLRHRGEPPDGPTAADVIIRRRDVLREVYKPGQSERLVFFSYLLPRVDLTVGVPEYTIEPPRRLVAEHRELLDELLTLADLPAGRLPAPATHFPVPRRYMDDLAAARHAVMLLQNEAVIDIVDNNAVKALQAVRSQLRIVEGLDEQPTQFGADAQFGAEFRILPSIEGLLHAAELDERMVASIETEVDRRARDSTIKWWLLGRRAWFADTCEKIVAGDLKLSSLMHGDPPPFEWVPTWLVRREQVRGTRTLTRLLEMGDDLPAMMDLARQAKREARSTSWGDYPFLAAFCAIAAADACRPHAIGSAMLESTRAGLAAERFRLSTGRFPTSLDELVPDYLNAVPVDPFDGKPLRMATTEKGIVIYSVGVDATDDGGDVAPTERYSMAPDIGFRLVRPERRGMVILDDPPPEPHPKRGGQDKGESLNPAAAP